MSTLPHDKEQARPKVPVRLGCAPAIAALLAGCTVGPDFVAPSPPQVSLYLPPTAEAANAPAWRGDGRAQFLSEAKPMRRDWWSGFASREIDSAVADALTGSPTLEGAQATLRRSQHALLAGQGIFFPQADAQAGASRQRYAPLQSGQPLPATDFNLFTLAATVSYTLDLWGGRRRLVEALAADVDARRAALAAAYLMLSANVVNTMIARAAYHDEAATTRGMLALLDEQIRLTRIQASAGTTAEGAVVALQSQRAALAATLPAIDLGQGEADDLLALLAGSHPAEWRAPELTLEAITLPAELPATVPSSLARRRPDIQQAEAELHIASAQVGTATAALYPDLTLSASGSFDSTSAGRLFSPAGRAWGLGAGLSAAVSRRLALEPAARRPGCAGAGGRKLPPGRAESLLPGGRQPAGAGWGRAGRGCARRRDGGLAHHAAARAGGSGQRRRQRPASAGRRSAIPPGAPCLAAGGGAAAAGHGGVLCRAWWRLERCVLIHIATSDEARSR